jgi:tRNA(adenine34) deaminase
MSEYDLQHLRASIALSRSAAEHGNQPFGAVLVDEHGKLLLRAENTQITERDCTGHAETNLMREASRRLDLATLAKCTLYASTEPCAMCAAAIYWGGVRRVVYALSAQTANELAGESADVLGLSCREVLARGQRKVEVVGPVLEQEAMKPLKEFWK